MFVPPPPLGGVPAPCEPLPLLGADGRYAREEFAEFGPDEARLRSDAAVIADGDSGSIIPLLPLDISRGCRVAFPVPDEEEDVKTRDKYG